VCSPGLIVLKFGGSVLRHDADFCRAVHIFNTCGPRMHPYDGRVVSNIIRQALAGTDIPLYGDGSQSRSFCYVDDLIDGMMKMMDAPDDCPGPINLGNPDEFSIRDLAELVVELTGSGSKIVEARALPENDPIQRRPDITKARSQLDWQPTVDLRAGLQRTVDWFKSIDLTRYRPPTPNY